MKPEVESLINRIINSYNRKGHRAFAVFLLSFFIGICRRESDQSYMDKLFIPVQGCLLEVVREQYADFYKDKERWHYLKKLDTKNGLLSLDGI